MSEFLSEREAEIFYAEQRGYASAMEAERKLHEARIEELEAKLAKAVEERDEALNQLDSARHSVAVLEKRVKTFCDGWGIADKGRIEAEAKLAKAVMALQLIEQFTNTHDQRAVADEALAELTGQDDA